MTPKIKTDDLLMSDAGNAEILVRLAGKDLKWCGAMSKDGWVIWDGKRWLPDETNEIVRRAKKVAAIWQESAPDPCNDLVKSPEEVARNASRKEIMKHVVRCESTVGLKAMIEQAAAHETIAVRRLAFDTDPWLFNAKNGTANLRTFTLHKHRREDLITKVGGVELKDAECPNWLAYVQRAMGYSLTGITREQCFFLLYGIGRNGKGTLVETLRKILNEYAVNIQVETLSMRREGGTSPDLATMAGARVVTASEGKEAMNLDEGLIKQITGGDPLTANPKYRDPFTFFPEFKLWFSANHKPVIRGTDLGIWSRVHMIPFTQSFTGDREDKGLRARLDAELDGIFAWVLQGAKDWAANGLRPPASVVNATAEYRKEMDVIGQWIEECCNGKAGKEMTTLVADLYRSYTQWCKDNGIYAKPAKWLGQQLDAKGYHLDPGHSGGRKRKGILLLSPVEDEPKRTARGDWRSTDH
jgi:putative DNA primase/helicase